VGRKKEFLRLCSLHLKVLALLVLEWDQLRKRYLFSFVLEFAAFLTINIFQLNL